MPDDTAAGSSARRPQSAVRAAAPPDRAERIAHLFRRAMPEAGPHPLHELILELRALAQSAVDADG